MDDRMDEPMKGAAEIYARGMVHLRGAERAVADGVALAEARGDQTLSGELGALLTKLKSVHRKLHRAAKPHLPGEIVVMGGGDK